METTLITTPSGHKVTIKTGLTYGDKRQIERVFLQSAKVDPRQPEKMNFEASAMYDAQDLAVKLLVTKVEIKDGTTFDQPDERLPLAILEMDEADGKAVYDRINELTTPTDTPEKKGA